MCGRIYRRYVLLFLFLLPVSASGQYAYHFGRNKIQYEDFEWHVLETEHFDIYYYPEMLDLAEHGAFFAEEAYSELQNRFNFSLNHRVPIIFYSSNLHFKQTNVTPGFIPDGVGGFFEFMKGRVVLPANGNLHRFRRVVRHEITHVFTFNMLSRVMRDHRIPISRVLPLWFTEGLAEYWSGRPDHQHEMVIRDALYTNYLEPLESIYRIRGSFVMYKQGEAICRFISEEYGEEKLLELIENAWKSKDFRKILEITTKDSFSELSEKWQDWMKAQYYPNLPDVEMPSLIASGLSTSGFNAKPTYYEFGDGRKVIYFVGNHEGFSNVYQVPVDDQFRPLADPEVLIPGGRSDRFEAFHLFESRIAVSNDGRLAFVTKSGETDVVHEYDLEKDYIRRTYRFTNVVALYSPTWSPDGDRFAFSSIGKSGYSDLYIYDLESQELQRLTNDSFDDRDPSWSPDGKFIAFSSDRTPTGINGSYNLFTYGVGDGQIRYVTYGAQSDFSPSWSPDGGKLVYTSTSTDSTGRFGAQDVWVADMSYVMGLPAAVASATDGAIAAEAPAWRSLRRLTSLASAAFDPIWTPENRILFTSFEGLSFTIRQLANADSLVSTPREEHFANLTGLGPEWTFERIEAGASQVRSPYKKSYRLDFAQGSVTQSPVLGTTGGAMVSFSDMLGDDYLNLIVFNTSQNQGSFFRNLSFQASRVQLHRRANIGYGLYRFRGRRYDRTDPDAPRTFPLLFETIYGGFGSLSYPFSKFRRIEFGTSLNLSHKEIYLRNIDRDALLLSNSLSLVHDNALYWMNGPIQGWRAKATIAYTSDILYSNVSYFTLIGDVRHYLRIGRDFTLASWFMGRYNDGREARLHVLGGSWDLRGFRIFSVRGSKMWFTSHEFRFPILNAPGVILPILAPFGIANLRGALFFDAAHAWIGDYHEKIREINAGETVGSAGLGFRMNLFGALVLRYDLGYRYRDGFKTRERYFKQFFFGWDF